MSAFAARVDHFVRWFFNSSPTTEAIEGQAPGRGGANMSARHDRRTTARRDGVLAAAGVVALVLLGVFYSVVAAAVERGASRAAATELSGRASAQRPAVMAHRPGPASILARRAVALAHLRD